MLLAAGLFAAAPASAAYEQVGIFAGSEKPPAEPGVFPEEVQLGGVGGMAVNYTGAGGVKPGTVYAVSEGELMWVTMFEPNADGSLSFLGAWQVRLKAEPYKRCGQKLVGTPCEALVGGGPRSNDVDVDQATGNVYVLSSIHPNPDDQTVYETISEYDADGSEEITRFGKSAGHNPTPAPDEIHPSSYPGGIAVDGAGSVYVLDIGASEHHRLMVFRPQTPGDYAHYVYAGQEHDFADGPKEFQFAPVADAAGNIYTRGEQSISEYDPAHPADPPICEFNYPKGGITAITVNPATGEPFFFSYKDEKVRRLSACKEGKFTELESFKRKPTRDFLSALAFDPVHQFDPTRPPGILYGGAPAANNDNGSGEPGTSSLGYIFAQPAEVTPVIEEESVAHVTAATALLRAQVNPKGSETTYAFQYLTQSAYEEAGNSFAGAAEAPPGGAVLGAGQAPLSATAAIGGLQPDTVYRYRAVATSHCSAGEPAKVCEGTGPTQSFRTFPLEAPGLADHRAWELVSPTQKNGGQVFPAEPNVSSCLGIECKPGSTISTRHPIQSTPDGEAITYRGTPFSPSEGGVAENQYVSRRGASGWQTTTLTPTLLQFSYGYRAFDESLAVGVFEQQDPPLSPEAPSGYPDLYRQPTADPGTLVPLLTEAPPNRQPGSGSEALQLSFEGASSDLSRIFFAANDALSGETPLAPAATDGGPKKNNLYEWTQGQLRLVNVLPGNAEAPPGAILRAVSDDGSRVIWQSEAGQPYVRENGDTTRAIPGPGKFLAASRDGSRVLLDNGRLYDLQTETTTDLSEGKGGFEGILGHGDDLSSVYFLDTAVLDETPNQGGQKAEAGKRNLYAWREGEVSFLANLPANDGEAFFTSQASPNGRFFAFVSEARLTGYDNTGPCKLINSGAPNIFAPGPCLEAFLYDSATAKLTCASCNPTGTRPLGRTVLRRLLGARYLTDEGRLFFDSEDSLVPSDTNEGVEDVYQYEPNGVGTCTREVGCTTLISAGREASDSNFLAMNSDGRDVFFTTRDQLTLRDKDDLVDVYDAREGGGIAAETEVARGECQGEACVPAIVAPNDPTPASSSFEGAGNVDEQKTAKKHQKKHAKKKHQKKKHQAKHSKRAAKHNRGGKK